MDKKYRIRLVLRELNRKLTLLKIERKASKRREIIDDILLDEKGEFHQLEELLGLDKEH